MITEPWQNRARMVMADRAHLARTTAQAQLADNPARVLDSRRFAQISRSEIRMATFSQWLDQDAQIHRTDDVGACARAWFEARSEYEGGHGGRPSISAVKSITRWLMEQSGVELPPERIADAMATAGNLYRKAEARLVAGDPPPPTQVHVVQPAQPPQLPPASQVGADELRREWLEAAGVIGDHLGRIESKLDTLTHLVNGLIAQPHEQLVMVDDAGELRDNDGRLESELPEAVLSWQGGLHMIHCRDDRCMGGKMCDCPCHELLPVAYDGAEVTSTPADQHELSESGIDEAVEIGRAFGLDPQMLADAAAAARQRLDQNEARQRSLRRQDELSRPAHPDQQARTYRSLYRSQRDDQDSK